MAILRMDRKTLKALRIKIQQKSELFFDEIDKTDGYPEDIEFDTIRLILACNAEDNESIAGLDVKKIVRAISDESPGVPPEGLKYTYYFFLNAATDEASPYYGEMSKGLIDSFNYMKTVFYL